MPPSRSKRRKKKTTSNIRMEETYCKVTRMPLLKIYKVRTSWKPLTFSPNSSILGKAWFLDPASVYRCVSCYVLLHVIPVRIIVMLSSIILFSYP